MKKRKFDFGYACLFVLLVFFSTWLYLRFPIYNEQKIIRIIDHNMPIGTMQADAIRVLNTLKWKGVMYEEFDSGIKAYFPDDFIDKATLFL